MDIEGMSPAEFSDVLLANVRRRNTNALKTHLQTVPNPDWHLNRIYEERNEQKCTLLALACLNRCDDILLMLLNDFQPDLDVLNQVRLKDKDRRLETFHDVTILWIAAAMNNFPLVKLLVERGARVNHTTSTKSTPLRCACCNDNVEMARFLVDNGADVRINKEKHYTNLVASVFNGHLQMVTYLVDELGCDVNECLDDGRSPLAAAVYHGSMDLVQLLLARGARSFSASYDHMTPLMLAADKRRTDLVQAISSHCSIIEQIEAEELLGSAFACAEIGDCDFHQSFEHLSRALELRSVHHLQKTVKEATHEIFHHRHECQTLEELFKLRYNADNMVIEALLIRERLLGPLNTRYRHGLRYRGAQLADRDQYYQAISCWMYEIQLYKQYSIDLDKEKLRHFVYIFTHMQSISLSISIPTLESTVNIAIEQLHLRNEDFDFHLTTLLFFVTIISQMVSDTTLADADRRILYRLVRSIVRHGYQTDADGFSLLHLCLNSSTSIDHSRFDSIHKYPCLSTARLLLQCGVDANAMDSQRNTALHLLASEIHENNEQIFRLLYHADVHLDYANHLGQRPLDVALCPNMKQLLRTKMKLNLKCSCAQLIRKTNIPIHEVIGSRLIAFVERH